MKATKITNVTLVESISSKNLKKHIHTIREDYKDHKCDSCGKTFHKNLKKHIHTIREDIFS